jgi:ketosteroid isomerase-like protein
MSARLLLIIILSAGALRVQGQTQPDSAEVVHAINSFVDAFSNLQWEKFSACWADEATAFFPPSAKFPYRAGTKQEILQIFEKVFQHARQQRSAPPYLSIHPLDQRIQLAGTVAIVTFTLDDPDLLGRRTLVLKKEGGKWLIIHLHASGATREK